MYSKILIPLDGSTTAEKVLPYARCVARRVRIPVELLAVIDIAEMAAHLSAKNARFLESFMERGTEEGTSYLRGIATTFPDVDVKCTIERGRPEDVIIQKGGADRETLIAMATHGRSGLNRFLLGSVAEKVLRGTANPLLLIRATEEAKSVGEAALKSIIVPLDDSPLAESVLPMAANLAKSLDLEIELFRAFSVPYNVYAGSEGYYAINYDEIIAEVRNEAREYLERKLNELRAYGVKNVSCIVKEGFAGDEIIAMSRNTPGSLIAMCSHGRSGMTRWVLGSVTETVVRHSAGPVLITRSAQE